MEESSTEILEAPAGMAEMPDRLSVKRWLIVYLAYLLALAIPAAVMLSRLGVGWRQMLQDPAGVAEAAAPTLKLLIFAVYISLACTFLPLPTGPMVSAVALQQFAPSGSLWTTTVLVASVGAAASTVANLHDFHLFTLVLRQRHVGRVRRTKLYQGAARWFGRRPFGLLVVFNVLPIPIDVIRMLAASYRYPLRPFTAANFIGRWIRYAVIAAVTFQLGDHGWIVAAALLAAALVLAGFKIAERLLHSRPGHLSDQAST